MWKRMLHLSNGTREELSTGGNHETTNGRLPTVLRAEENGAAGRLESGQRELAPALLSDFEKIYQGGSAKPPRLAYGVLKVADMLSNAHLSGMSTETKRSALLMALEAGGAKVDEILQDAIVRQRLLNEYEEARQRDLEGFAAATAEQNHSLQAELDRVTSQYMARIESNLEEVARARDNFRMWQKRKQQETQRISDAAACCVPESGSAVANNGLTVVLERASATAAR